VIEGLYTALGDRPRFDSHLDSEITIWESDAAQLLTGLDELDRLRDERARRAGLSSASVPVSVAAERIQIDVWDATGLARYVLRARHDGSSADECFRVTDVLRRSDRGWRIVHHHAEAMT
jgi:hypothetical protein